MRAKVQLESAWLAGRRQASEPRVVNISATLRTTTHTAAGVIVLEWVVARLQRYDASVDSTKRTLKPTALSAIGHMARERPCV